MCSSFTPPRSLQTSRDRWRRPPSAFSAATVFAPITGHPALIAKQSRPQWYRVMAQMWEPASYSSSCMVGPTTSRVACARGRGHMVAGRRGSDARARTLHRSEEVAATQLGVFWAGRGGRTRYKSQIRYIRRERRNAQGAMTLKYHNHTHTAPRSARRARRPSLRPDAAVALASRFSGAAERDVHTRAPCGFRLVRWMRRRPSIRTRRPGPYLTPPPPDAPRIAVSTRVRRWSRAATDRSMRSKRPSRWD